MFVRKRGKSHQLIESFREGGKIRQRIIANLGPHPSLKAALAADPKRFGHLVEQDDGAPAEAVVSSVVSKPNVLLTKKELEAAKEAHLRAKVFAALAPLTHLAGILNTHEKREAIRNAFYHSPETPDPALVKSVRFVANLLPQFLGDLNMAPRGKRRSRADRWSGAVQEAVEVLEELQELQSEYADWLSNIPEQLADGQQALVQKLEAIGEIEVGEVINAVSALGDIDPPLGFGRD